MLALPGVPAACRTPDFTATTLPLIPVELSKDVTLQEIRLESFFPADDATAAHRWDAARP